MWQIELVFDQLPGSCAPRSIDPSSSMTPGQPMPMKGASCTPFLLAAPINPLSISTSDSTACSRFTSSSSPCRQSENFHTFVLERSGAEVELHDARAHVPMSTPRMASNALNIQAGAKLVGIVMDRQSSNIDLVGLEDHCSTADHKLAHRLARNPPPTTMRCVSFQSFSLRKRRMTRANSSSPHRRLTNRPLPLPHGARTSRRASSSTAAAPGCDTPTSAGLWQICHSPFEADALLCTKALSHGSDAAGGSHEGDSFRVVALAGLAASAARSGRRLWPSPLERPLFRHVDRRGGGPEQARLLSHRYHAELGV